MTQLQPTSGNKTFSSTIKVNIDSKNITLPTNKATLNAFISNSTLNKLNLQPQDLRYSWKLVSIDGNDTPNNSMVISGVNKETLVL